MSYAYKKYLTGIFFILNTRLVNKGYNCYQPKRLNNYFNSGLVVFSNKITRLYV